MDMKVFKLVNKYIFKYKFSLLMYLLFNIIAWIVSIFSPYLTGKYIDVLVEARSIEAIVNFTKIILFISILSIMSSFVVSYLYVKIQTKAMVDLNFYVLNHVIKLPILYFKDVNSTYLTQRTNADSNTIISFVLGNMLEILTNALTVIFLMYISIKINLKLTLVLTSLIPLYLFLYFTFRKPLYKQSYSLKEKQNKFFSKMNEYLHNVYIVKKHATFQEAQNELDKGFKEMFYSLLKHTKISCLFSSSASVVKIGAQIIIFSIGGFEILNGSLTVGQFTIINSYFSMIINSISYFLNLGKSYQDALVSYDRLQQILDEQKESNGEIQINGINTIELKNVLFSYDGSKDVIYNFSYKFQKGKIYCIIGENGVGKSTLINLILGIFNDYFAGEILYNSIEIRKLDMYHIRRKIIGISEQEPKLINDSIFNNITYGIDIYNYEEIKSLLEKLNLNIHKFSQGLNTNIYEASRNISGGEKLKISLIRAFLKDSDVIILDEPTSALDFDSIQKLSSLIQEIKKEKIILIVTHNQQLLSIADDIIDLNMNKSNELTSNSIVM